MKRRVLSCWLAAVLLLSAGGVIGNMKAKAAQPVKKSQMGVIAAQGVWHRPNITGTETDLAGICNVLDTFRETGINLVFLETFYHGMTVYKSSFVPYYTGFDAFDYKPYPDYLSAFVAEAEKRGIEVHAWVEDFYIGVNENYFTQHLPNWLMLTKSGSYRHSEGADYGGYIFLDPANKDVRDYLIRFYDELLTKFPKIAGLNLDYIRYPVSSQSDDTGFTDAAMAGFAAQEGITFPDNATRDQKVAAVSACYGQWVNYRANQITAFVGQVYDMVKSEHKGVLLSTAVFPEQGKSFGDKKQDFNTWLSRGYLDIITPMAYYDDVNTLKNALEAMLPGLSECYCYAGISPTYHSLPNGTVLKQMETALAAGADGFVHFGSQSILQKPNYIELLKENTQKTILPHKAAKTLVEAITQSVEQKLTAAGESTQPLVAMLTDLAGRGDLQEVNRQLRLLVKYNLGQFVSERGEALIREDLEQLYRSVDVTVARLTQKGQLPETPKEPTVTTQPTTVTTTATTTQSTTTQTTTATTQSTTTQTTVPSTTETSVQTQTPEQPDAPQASQDDSQSNAAGWLLGAGAAAAAGAIGIHATRKGRKKQ